MYGENFVYNFFCIKTCDSHQKNAKFYLSRNSILPFFFRDLREAKKYLHTELNKAPFCLL